MTDPDLTPSFDEVSKTDAITGTNAGSALDGPTEAQDGRAVPDADAAVDQEMSNAALVNSEESGDVATDDSSETEETDDVGMSAEEAPGIGVSDVDLDEADARSDAAHADNAGGTGEQLGVDREEQFRLANDVATNDAVAGETVLGESAPLDETPYQGGNELGDVDLGETEDR